eukprot:TRINITY_DN6356_c0_g1_i1.p1 TRINITY_DN6356_c0_g1~~TRINITY_DN6356_c0_g1_i1.p1  ORF type:complete len:481 (-),score=86.83 TRINITY_DN6356_c0_g1_i1:258-1700(-)
MLQILMILYSGISLASTVLCSRHGGQSGFEGKLGAMSSVKLGGGPNLSDASESGLPLAVIAHRGASGRLPENTLEAYAEAIRDGADYVHCEVVMTTDAVPICCNGPNLVNITDVEQHPKFGSRKATNTIDGIKISGYFSVDFTLSEIKTLRVKQRFLYREQAFNGMYAIPTLAEMLQLLGSPQWGKRVGAYLETKNSAWHEAIGLKMEDMILGILSNHGYTDDPDVSASSLSGSTSPMVPFLPHAFLASFEPQSLRYLHNRTALPLVQLLDATWDQRHPSFHVITDGGDHTQLQIFDEIATYATAVGAWKGAIAPVDTEKKRLVNVTALVMEAHSRHLVVHAYTFRNEHEFLPFDFGEDPYAEYEFFISEVGVDGVITDFPLTAVNFLRMKELHRIETSEMFSKPHHHGASEFLFLALIFALAVVPMAMGMAYAVYRWRQAEQQLMWQEMAIAALPSGTNRNALNEMMGAHTWRHTPLSQ